MKKNEKLKTKKLITKRCKNPPQVGKADRSVRPNKSSRWGGTSSRGETGSGSLRVWFTIWYGNRGQGRAVGATALDKILLGIILEHVKGSPVNRKTVI